MKNDKMKLTKQMLENCKTAYDIEELAEEFDMSVGELAQEAEQFSLKGTECEGCKNAGFYNSMYPCNCCKRNKKDYFEKYK